MADEPRIEQPAGEQPSDFDVAFDEATGKTKPADTGKTDDGGKDGETDGGAVTDTGAGAGAGAGAAAAGAKGAGDTDNGGGDTGETEVQKLTKRLGELEHSTKSWEGRITAANREREAAVAEKEALAKRVAELEAQVKAGAAPADDDVQKELEALKKEYPDYAPRFWGLVERALSKAQKDATARVETAVNEVVEKRIKPIETAAEKEKRDAHFNAIREKHADFAEVAASKDMQDWIASRPAYLRPGLLEVISRGNADQVIGLIDDFKQAMKDKAEAEKKAADDLKAKRDKQTQAGAAVPGRSGGIPAGAVQVDKNDFDGAWDQATKT